MNLKESKNRQTFQWQMRNVSGLLKLFLAEARKTKQKPRAEYDPQLEMSMTSESGSIIITSIHTCHALFNTRCLIFITETRTIS